MGRGFRKIPYEVKRSAVLAVMRGEPPAEVARRHGVCRVSVDRWSRALGPRVEREEREREEARRGRGRPGSRPKVMLLEVATAHGESLVVVNVGRDGKPAGTVQRVAGAPLGTEARTSARVVRKWEADARALSSALAGAVANLGLSGGGELS